MAVLLFMIIVWVSWIVWSILHAPVRGESSPENLARAYAAALSERDPVELSRLLAEPLDTAELADELVGQASRAGLREVQAHIGGTDPPTIEVRGRGGDGTVLRSTYRLVEENGRWHVRPAHPPLSRRPAMQG